MRKVRSGKENREETKEQRKERVVEGTLLYKSGLKNTGHTLGKPSANPKQILIVKS